MIDADQCQKFLDQLMAYACEGFPGADGEWLESWQDDFEKLSRLAGERLDVVDG